MKTKYVIKSVDSFRRWVGISNLFIDSLISSREALRQFNSLNAEQRISIRKRFSECDEIRNKRIPEEDRDNGTYKLSVMVDAHIIAADYNIDPLTVVMCVDPPCKLNERVMFK